jgi:hypothetical protein
MIRSFPMVIAIAAIFGAGAGYGLMVDRWGLSQEPGKSAKRLDQIPDALGDWRADTKHEIDEQSKAIGEIAGAFSCTYKNQRNGDVVTALIVCGRPGAIGAHTPDVCFVGQGQEMLVRTTKKFQLGPDLPEVECFTAVFEKTTIGLVERRRAFWTWSADGNWSAPQNPRLNYLGQNVLFKLYVTYQFLREDEKIEEGPGPDFLREFIPRINSILFEKPK